MNYVVLFEKYQKLYSEKVQLKSDINLLCEGYISQKIISGKKYYYLQKRVGNKLISKYIKSSNLDDTKKQIEKRRMLISRVNQINIELEKIEMASEILEENLHKRIIVYKKCTMIEDIPVIEREKVDEFSNAMLAIEGISAPTYAQREFDKWMSGEQNFADSYNAVLEKFNLIGDR